MNTACEYDLRKFVAPEIISGIDARYLSGRYMRNLGARKVLIVSDQGVMDAGWTRDVINSISAEKLQYEVFSDITPDQRAEQIMEGVQACNGVHCDAIVAVGGGSVMDCTREIGIACSNNREVLEFEGAGQVPCPGPPFICVPTTAGSSADVSQFAIITDTRGSTKIAIVSKTVVPDVVSMDPVTTVTMAPYLTACTAPDALSHAVHVVSFNYDTVSERYRKIGEAMGVDMRNMSAENQKKAILSAFYEFNIKSGVRRILRQIGVMKPDIPHLASILPVEMTVRVVEQDDALCAVIVARNISERIKTENALNEAREELMRNEKLSVLGRLSGTVSHELRTPRSAISNAAYYLKMVPMDAEDVVKEYIDIIISEIENSKRIITDFLDFALTKKAEKVVTSVFSLVRAGLEKCHIPSNTEIRINIPDMLPPVTADPYQIVQVLYNLIVRMPCRPCLAEGF